VVSAERQSDDSGLQIEMKQRDITPYNILKKIVPARKMVGKIARVKIKMVISLVKLSFLFNSEITYVLFCLNFFYNICIKLDIYTFKFHWISNYFIVINYNLYQIWQNLTIWNYGGKNSESENKNGNFTSEIIVFI
jgi:hypothetical protein